jgi:anti-sigma factor RsiW
MKTNNLESLYFKAPQGFKEELENLSRPQAPKEGVTIGWAWLRYAAVFTAVLISLVLGRLSTSPTSEEMISQEVVSNHVRSLMANHLIDIASTDRHTVKPWFNGKLDFSPKVVDLAAEGFPLVGGRLDYLGSRPVAALIYKRDKHIINFLTWPSTDGASQKMVLVSRQGYSLFHWVSEGMQYWVISDLNANDLKTFAELTKR